MRKFKFLMIMIWIVAIPACLFFIADQYFSNRTEVYIAKQVSFVTSDIFTKAIEEHVNAFHDVEKLIIYQYDNNKRITSVLVNTTIVNQLIALASTVLSSTLDEKVLEKRLGSLELPFGQFIFRTIFANMGPKIKITILPVYEYNADVITETKAYGINNTLLEVYLLLSINVQAMIPFQAQDVKTKTKVTLVSQILQGEVPRYYYSGSSGPIYFPEEGSST